MPLKFELDKLRDVDDIISDTVTFFRENLKQLVKIYFTINGIFLLAALVTAIINYYQVQLHRDEGTSIFGLTYFLNLLINLIAGMVMLLTFLSYIAIYKEKGKEPPTVEEVWGYVKYYFIRTLGAYIVVVISVVLGTVFCIIPGIYLFVVMAFVFPIIVMENATFAHALDRCFKIIKNNWWSVFGSMLIVTLIITAAIAVVAIPVGLVVEIYAMMSGTSLLKVIELPLTFIGYFVQFFYTLPIIALALNYFSLTEQTDNTSLIARIENFGVINPDKEEFFDEEY